MANQILFFIFDSDMYIIVTYIVLRGLTLRTRLSTTAEMTTDKLPGAKLAMVHTIGVQMPVALQSTFCCVCVCVCVCMCVSE